MSLRTSIIWKIPKHELEIIIKNNLTVTAVLKHFNLCNKGRNYHTLQKRLKEDNIDYSHIKLGSSCNLGRKFDTPKIPLEEVLIVGSTFNRSHLKKRLLTEGYFKNICYKCGMGPEWCGAFLSLQIDHINGTSNDNRLENLRLLCPNCHSQTETYAGKSRNKSAKNMHTVI